MTNLIALPNGTELVGDYRIERVLGAGGFGITYLADEMALARAVTIKEYFPSDFAARAPGNEAAPRSQDSAGDYRWGLDRFIEEAQTLAKFNHPHIVRVYRYFRANNTGYMVLHFEEGQSFKNWLKGLNRAPRQKELDAIIPALLDALELIHNADFLHRDIAPDNIIIRKDGAPVLIDFGSARGEIASHSKTVSALVKPGYSPYEQYAETSRQQGPWTDIYALAATLYHAVTGKRPPDAPSRMVKDEMIPARDAAIAAYRSGFLKAIDRALALNVEARPQSIAAWRGDLLAPEPAKQGWLTRGREKKRSEELAEAAAELAKPANAPLPNAVPPQPDAPGAQGRLLDFVEGLKKKTEPIPAQPLPASLTDRLANAGGGAESTVVLDAPPVTPAKSKSKPAPKAATAASHKPPRPRPVKSGASSRWRPVLVKLVIGAGIAGAAVAMQDKLPRLDQPQTQVENRVPKTAPRQEPDLQTAAIPSPLIGQLKGHTGAVNAIAYSDDGRLILTAGKDSTLKVWTTGSNTLVRTIALDQIPVTSLALSGTRALTGHSDGTIVLWDIEHGARLSSFKRNDANIWSVVFTGSPERFAAASHDWKIALWDLSNPSAPVHVLEGHENAVQALAFSSSGPYLASGSADKTVKLWNVETLELMRTYRGLRDFVTALAFSPDGKLLAGASLDGSIRIWSSQSARMMRRLYGHTARIGGLSFSPSGELLASASEDGTVRLWDVRRSRTARAFAGHLGAVGGVGFAPDGQSVASGGEDGTVRFWTAQLPGRRTQ